MAAESGPLGIDVASPPIHSEMGGKEGIGSISIFEGFLFNNTFDQNVLEEGPFDGFSHFLMNVLGVEDISHKGNPFQKAILGAQILNFLKSKAGMGLVAGMLEVKPVNIKDFAI